MDPLAYRVTELLMQIMLFACGFAFFGGLLRMVPRRRRIWHVHLRHLWDRDGDPSRTLMRVLGVREQRRGVQERKQLLRGAGFLISAVRYEVLRRVGIGLFAGVSVLGIAGLRDGQLLPVPASYTLASGGIGLLLLVTDRTLLSAVKKRRADTVVQEIYALCNQLLYYTGSNMNLHAKLMRCMPHTRTIRPMLDALLNEWYHDAGEALDAFKRRLGTDEGSSFAETLNALRQYEDDAYYELLRQRIRDYKDKLELLRAGKKETTSYVLFVLAGIAVMNTFRVFIYPWVLEGQKLFNSLN